MRHPGVAGLLNLTFDVRTETSSAWPRYQLDTAGNNESWWMPCCCFLQHKASPKQSHWAFSSTGSPLSQAIQGPHAGIEPIRHTGGSSETSYFSSKASCSIFFVSIPGELCGLRLLFDFTHTQFPPHSLRKFDERPMQQDADASKAVAHHLAANQPQSPLVIG